MTMRYFYEANLLWRKSKPVLAHLRFSIKPERRAIKSKLTHGVKNLGGFPNWERPEGETLGTNFVASVRPWG